MNTSRSMQSITTQRTPRRLLLGMTLLLPVLSSCGSSSDETKTAQVGPVEEVYNNGVDALNARRFTTADARIKLRRLYPSIP